jgi:MFS family permease
MLFMVGLGPSAISSWMQRVGVGWLAWELTHSPAWLGLIAAADLIPFLFLSPFAGVFIDRSSPHKVLLTAQWLQFAHAATLACMMYINWLQIELLFGLTMFSGVVSAFGTSARHAVVPNTVPKALVGTAVSLDSALFQASRFVGPAIAALVIPTWGVFGAFAAHTLGSFVFSLVMQQMRMPAPERD